MARNRDLVSVFYSFPNTSCEKACRYPVFPTPVVEKAVFSPIYVLTPL
jgi:hypothetical protein